MGPDRTASTVRALACAAIVSALLLALLPGCAVAPLTQEQNDAVLAQPNPVAPVEPAKNAVNAINTRTNDIEAQQPSGSQEP